MSAWRRAAHATRAESGMTLVELLVSMTVMGVVAMLFLTVLFSIQTNIMRQQVRSVANDQARLGLEQMDREIRSGNLLYDPSESFPSPTCGGYACVSGFSIRVYTQVNAPTRTPPQQCVQWIVQDLRLMRRAWAPGATTNLSGWRVIAEHVVNRDVSPQVPAFSIDPTPGGRVLAITLLVNPRLGLENAPRTVRLNTSLAIRNSTAGDPCSPMPAS